MNISSLQNVSDIERCHIGGAGNLVTHGYHSVELLRCRIEQLLMIIERLDAAVSVFKAMHEGESTAHQSTKQSCRRLAELLANEVAHHDHCRDALDSATA